MTVQTLLPKNGVRASGRKLTAIVLAGVLGLPAATALGHPGHPAGLAHPMGGIDPLLPMVAIGLWVAQLIFTGPGRRLFRRATGALLVFVSMLLMAGVM